MLTRYVLDGHIITELPQGWNNRVTAVNLDKVFKGRLVTEEATLTWFDDGYQYIKSVFDNNIVGEISIQIQNDALHNGTWVTDYVGILKMPGCEFNIAPNYVKTKVEDDGWYAKINNNKSIKTTLNNGRSKNDIAITVADERLMEAASYAAASCTPSFFNRKCYTIDECFRFMIDFLTDGEVGYLSETFDDSFPSSGEYADYVVMLGYELRLGATNTELYLELDYDTLYKEVDKKFNIGFRMERIAGRTYIRIEKDSWFFNQDSFERFNDVREIKRSVDAERLYSAIGTGSSVLDDTASIGFPENIRWYGFNDEQFYLMGKSNIDRVLDLKSDWVISSNIIEDVLTNNADSYDKDIFIIEIQDTDGTTVTAHQTNWLGGTDCFFNEHLTNRYVIDRWLDGIPSVIGAQLGQGGDNRFKAERTFDSDPFVACVSVITGNPRIITNEPFQFNNDYTAPALFDPSNRYGNGTVQGTPVDQADSRYTANSSGLYIFELVYKFRIRVESPTTRLKVLLQFKLYDSSNVLIGYFSNETWYDYPANIFFPLPPVETITFNQEIPMTATDYVIVNREFQLYTNDVNNPGTPCYELQDLAGSTFACIFSSADTGGEFTTTEIVNQRLMKYVVKVDPCTEAQVQSILADTTQPIYLNTDGNNNYKGWIDDIKFNRSEGTADITLLGRRIDEPRN